MPKKTEAEVLQIRVDIEQAAYDAEWNACFRQIVAEAKKVDAYPPETESDQDFRDVLRQIVVLIDQMGIATNN